MVIYFGQLWLLGINNLVLIQWLTGKNSVVIESNFPISFTQIFSVCQGGKADAWCTLSSVNNTRVVGWFVDNTQGDHYIIAIGI